MKIKQITKSIFQRWRRIPLWQRIVGVGALVLITSYSLIFFIPKTVPFAYSSQECVGQLTLLPGISKQTGQSDFSVRYENTWKLGGASLASFKTCFDPVNAPTPGVESVATAPFGGWFAMKQYRIIIPEAAKAKTTAFVDQTIPTTRPLEIALDQPDETFTYAFVIGEHTADCTHNDKTLSCAIDALDLKQGATYDAQLERYFGEERIAVIGKGEVKTLLPLVLKSSTLSEGQVVYDKPTQFSYIYDKKLASAKVELARKTEAGYETIPTSVKMNDATLDVLVSKELARDSEFRLTFHHVEAEDGSALDGEYVVNFRTAAGPKVTGISVGTTGVPLGGTITLNFDQPIANVDAAKSLIGVEGMSAQVSVRNDQVFISYSAGVCADFSIIVRKGFKNAADITQTDDWRFGGRTLCYTTFSIGTSRQGKSIIGYSFGSGGKTVLYTGSIHGNEYSSRLLMNTWINELDANVRTIPAGTRVVVVPLVNPDGYAAGSRYNAANVDLNRNYNTSDWQQDVQTVNGDPFPGGGGSAPGSEPETQALMALTSQLQPALTMSFHSSASYAIANTCGNSSALAAQYASITGYRNMTGVSGAFSYQITGTYDDWICERLGLPSVLIELATSSSAEFSRNRPGLWAMLKSV